MSGQLLSYTTNVLESLPHSVLSFTSQDISWQSTSPRRTIWPSLGKALWADHCQVMLCFNSRHFNASFVQSCSRNKRSKQTEGPLEPFHLSFQPDRNPYLFPSFAEFYTLFLKCLLLKSSYPYTWPFCIIIFFLTV